MYNPWLEYFIVVASLASTVAVGIYFSRGKSSLQDYMLGGRKMSVIPISLSIVATYLSGASMVSTTQEVYLYGFQLWWLAVAYAAYGLFFAYAILPVSYSVKSPSTFEFFDRRFKGHVRKYASLMYAMEMILHTAMSQFVPALSLSQATGFPVMPTAFILSAISWVYTASGGFRAVTYADSYQAVLFIGVIVFLFYFGSSEVGGFSQVWHKSEQGHRLEFIDLNLDYTLRYSLPLITIGSLHTSTRAFMSPSFHQRVVAMPSYEHAKNPSSLAGKTLWASAFDENASSSDRYISTYSILLAREDSSHVATIWSSVLTGICLIFTHSMGLVVYAYFAGCDPVLAEQEQCLIFVVLITLPHGLLYSRIPLILFLIVVSVAYLLWKPYIVGSQLKGIGNHASILPYFVEQLSKNTPGLTGLFLSGVIAAGLSTTTSCWNTVSCTLYEDLVKGFLPADITKKTAMRIITIILFLVALISTSCIYIIMYIPSLIEATTTLKSFALVSCFTLYVCGMILPWINSKGAIAGSLVSSIVTTYVAISSQNAKITGKVKNVPKVLTNAQCIVNGTANVILKNSTTTGFAGFGMLTVPDPTAPWYDKLSFSYLPLPGTFVGLAIAFLVSHLTGNEDLTKLDREMIIPSMRWVLPPKPSHVREEQPLKITGDTRDE